MNLHRKRLKILIIALLLYSRIVSIDTVTEVCIWKRFEKNNICSYLANTIMGHAFLSIMAFCVEKKNQLFILSLHHISKGKRSKVNLDFLANENTIFWKMHQSSARKINSSSCTIDIFCIRFQLRTYIFT